MLARSNSVSPKRGAATGVETIIYPLGYFADVEARDNNGDENDLSGVYAVSYGRRDLDLPPGTDHDLLVAVIEVPATPQQLCLRMRFVGD